MTGIVSPYSLVQLHGKLHESFLDIQISNGVENVCAVSVEFVHQNGTDPIKFHVF